MFRRTRCAVTDENWSICPSAIRRHALSDSLRISMAFLDMLAIIEPLHRHCMVEGDGLIEVNLSYGRMPTGRLRPENTGIAIEGGVNSTAGASMHGKIVFGSLAKRCTELL
jgi:hypothetical protein